MTRLIAVSAHAVDVALSLGRDPWTTTLAAAIVRPTLVDLAGGDLPLAELGWDDCELLIVATGRRTATTTERDILGDLATQFPLIS